MDTPANPKMRLLGEFNGVRIWTGDNGMTGRSQSSKPWLKDTVYKQDSTIWILGGKEFGFCHDTYWDDRLRMEIAVEELTNFLRRHGHEYGISLPEKK